MKKSTLLPIFIFLLNFTCFYGIILAQNRPGLSLKETFDLYVQSVQNSDLENLFTTVSVEGKFFFLTANGRLIDSREGYYKFHEDWFKETDWEMPVELLEVHEGKEYGYTLATFHFKGKTTEKEIYYLDSYFTLIFHKENDMWKVVADICTPIGRHFSDANVDVRYSAEQMYLFDIIKNRRTVRKFKSTPVPEEHILKILDAARFAPTAGNQQPWKFLVIQDREKLNRLKAESLSWFMKAYEQKKRPPPEELQSIHSVLLKAVDNALSAPVYVAVLVDSAVQYPDYIVYDGTLAAGYLMLAARTLGYGTGFYTSFFPEKEMKNFFQIPDQYQLICFTPIGVPEEWPTAPPKKPLEELVIFESFSR